MSRARDGQRAPTGSGDEVVLTLDRARDLFAPPALDEFGGSADVPSGIEQLRGRLLARRPRPRRPACGSRSSSPRPSSSRASRTRCSAAVRRYCELKLTDLEDRQRATLRHQGWSALLVSVPLLFLSLVVTAAGDEHRRGNVWDSILGDGLLLVFAWVVLWYPLDTLLWYGRPLKHEIVVVRAMRDLDLVVSAETAPVGAAAAHDRSTAPAVDLDPVAAAARPAPGQAGAAVDRGGRRGAGRGRLGSVGRNRAGR